MRSIGVPTWKWNQWRVLAVWRLVMMSPRGTLRVLPGWVNVSTSRSTKTDHQSATMSAPLRGTLSTQLLAMRSPAKEVPHRRCQENRCHRIRLDHSTHRLSGTADGVNGVPINTFEFAGRLARLPFLTPFLDRRRWPCGARYSTRDVTKGALHLMLIHELSFLQLFQLEPLSPHSTDGYFGTSFAASLAFLA
jgi:hypothetical protein